MQCQKILVVGPAWVGDMVMAQSLFAVLKQQHLNCQIDVIAPPWSLSVAAFMPQVSQLIELNIAHGQFAGRTRYQMGFRLKSEGYTQAIVLPNSWKSALVPFFAKIPKRTGYIGEFRKGLLNDARKLDKHRLHRTVDRFVALANARFDQLLPEIIPPALRIDDSRHLQLREQFKLNQSGSAILALCPGAEYGSSKQWPEAHYAALARHYLDKGWQIWLFGSGKDQQVCHAINQLTLSECTDLSGRTRLSEAVELLSMATHVVSNDSGLMHIAAALNKPLVALYGSSDPSMTPPLGDHAEILSLTLDCAPCFQRECQYQHRNCMELMHPQMVVERLDSLCAS
ncbi:MAG: lipopolysaccharide heptosyltransferase II [Gammaproteobacteria bacterium]|nr:lipopolysaccharide heptosyltransferase II [Gammaproteobacteria bacterium]